MGNYVKITLNKGREDSVKRRHPWVFSGAINKVDGKITDGDLVDVLDYRGNYLATGFASTGSIAVKIVWFGPHALPNDLWDVKLKKAFDLRQQLGFTDNKTSNTYRLVFSEADGLPGLIADYYNGVVVIQAHSTGMHLFKQEIAEALLRLYDNKLTAIYDKSRETLAKSGIVSEGDSFIHGSAKDIIVTENSNKFIIDFIAGQKTGFFLDQRDNRKLLGSYAAGKKVLNAFSYTGGFSVYALKAGARHVTSLDVSRKAMDTLEQNLLLNAGFEGTNQSVVEDAKVWLQGMDKDFDIVVLDPPAFAKRQTDRHKAIQGYRYINTTALKNIVPGGLLFTFSCSQAISNEQFTGMIMSAALEAGRDAVIIHHLGHSADHPVSVFHPEGEYLKGLVLQVQ